MPNTSEVIMDGRYLRMRSNGSSTGRLLVELVDRVSHRGGETLRIMAEANVTLQQVLLLTGLHREGSYSVSDLAVALNLSLPAISQAIDRLMKVGLVTRLEDPADRRKKQLATTEKANNLLVRLDIARASEYANNRDYS